MIRDPQEISKITDFFNPPILQKFDQTIENFKSKRKSKSKKNNRRTNSKRSKRPKKTADKIVEVSGRSFSKMMQDKEEGLDQTKVIKALYEQKTELTESMNQMELKFNKSEDKYKELLCQYQSSVETSQQRHFKTKQVLSGILLEMENLKKQKLIKEIAEEKGKLGFFSFSKNFGRGPDDWIEGSEVRSLLEEKVHFFFILVYHFK